MGNFFVDGSDPENPDDIGVDHEKMDNLIRQIDDELRKVGLYSVRFAVATPDEESAHTYGVHPSFGDEPPLLVMASLTVGDLAWTRVQSEKEKIAEELLRIEHGMLETDVEELRKKYNQE